MTPTTGMGPPETGRPGTARTLLSGWGRTAATGAVVQNVVDVEQVARAVTGPARSVLARGLGRCYGDAAQSAGGLVLSTSGLDHLELDPRTGLLVAGAGVSIDEILRACLPRGWFVPVTAGTRFVTVGGAVAADVHGKNHHVDGTFGRHLRWLELVDGTGTLRRLSPDGDDPDAFWATVGGLGLTGVVVRAALQLRPVESSWISVDTVRAPDLEALMSLLLEHDRRFRYTVAWVDVLATGRHTGRGVVTSGDHALAAQVTGERRTDDPLQFAPVARLTAPPVPVSAVNPLTARAFNEVWFRKAPAHREGELQRLQAYFHPLDGVRDWNRLYGPAGLLQYQFVVPDRRADLVGRALHLLRTASGSAFLGVLKRFGAADPGPLSFPQPGWTLAVDLPAGAGDRDRLPTTLDRLDDEVTAGGGAVYLVKDARCRPDLVAQMYPRLPEWRATRDRLDPNRRFVSDLSRRLSL